MSRQFFFVWTKGHLPPSIILPTYILVHRPFSCSCEEFVQGLFFCNVCVFFNFFYTVALMVTKGSHPVQGGGVEVQPESKLLEELFLAWIWQFSRGGSNTFGTLFCLNLDIMNIFFGYFFRLEKKGLLRLWFN